LNGGFAAQFSHSTKGESPSSAMRTFSGVPQRPQSMSRISSRVVIAMLRFSAYTRGRHPGRSHLGLIRQAMNEQQAQALARSDVE
jgi:hypothetical protein